MFCCGAISTVLGSLVAFKLMPLRNLGADGWKVPIAGSPHSFLCPSGISVDRYSMTSYPDMHNVPLNPAAPCVNVHFGSRRLQRR